MCITDLVACCETQGLGNWYFPGGGVIVSGGGNTFQTNRGQNEINNFMAQFVSGVDTLHQKEVFSAVSYLMLMVSTRIFMSTFVSF